MKVGVALNPHTPVHLLEDIIKDIDLVCIMSVNPGFGGQSFIENTFDKVKRLKKLINKRKASTLIEIDGGVNINNAKSLIDAGAGTAVYRASNNQSCVTISLDVKFIAPTRLGDEIIGKVLVKKRF